MRLTFVTAAAAVIVAGIIDPRLAGGLAIVVTLVAVGTFLAFDIGTLRAARPEPMAPFAPEQGDDVPVVETPDVADLVREIAQAKRALPAKVAADLRAAAAGRLLDEQRLDVRDVDDRQRARDLLGADLGAIVFDEARDVPLGRLGGLIEELDRL